MFTPIRPTHTGSARAHAPKSPKTKTPSDTSAVNEGIYRRAKRPLTLEDGRVAVAVRQTPSTAVEVGLRRKDGSTAWHLGESVMTSDVLRSWIRTGF